MSLGTWENTRMKKLDWIDIRFIKLSTAAFVLMVAKLWKPLLSLDWYWYAVICVLAAIRPCCKIFRK